MTKSADRYISGFAAQLRASGVSQVVLCPGSRSTPLTVGFTGDASFRSWLHLDERSAGYFALGLAREVGEPVALVCTSGTAAANFLPAVIEASLSRVPLVVLTADRPPELRDVGAAQTIDQVALYGSHARWAVDMPVADGSEAVERYATRTAARAVELARGAPAGPVHLNFPFREPLISGSVAGAGAAPSMPAIRVEPASVAISDELVARCAEAFADRRGVIVCGPESPPLPASEIATLAADFGWPVLADPLSGVRVGGHDLAMVLDSYDTLLRDPQFAAAVTPEVVLRFGAAMTSKATNGWLAGLTEAHHVVVDAAGWRDPDALATEVVRADAEAFCSALLARLSGGDATEAQWASLWTAANAAAREAQRAALDAFDEPFEGRAGVELAAALPDGTTLVAGNSMPVRDLDSFLPSGERELRIVGTRGASGIDGVVSSAVGAAAGREAGASGPVALLVGDLSFFHDLNGLWALRRHGLDLTVLLVNNDGGGIFHFLPQAEALPDRFEQWFGTPHGLDFRGAVEMHGGSFATLDGSGVGGGWGDALTSAIGTPGLSVLELRTERVRNVELHQQVWAQAHEAVRAVLSDVSLDGAGA
jgi:2-succinyl-5-enolpyruvyl-6-hydroxy-3-cyclohexene-1-carboxylate synthase